MAPLDVKEGGLTVRRINALWKMTLSLGLLFSLVPASAGVANTKAGKPPTSPAQGPAVKRDEVVVNYGQLAAKYLKDCDDWDVARPSGERLKQCLTIAKELRDKFDGFVQRLESISGKIKTQKRWTRELDDFFEKNAAKRGVASSLINQVKQNGGFREYFQKSLSESRTLKRDFPLEIEGLENAIKNNAPSEDVLFQRISYASPSATTPVGERLRKALRWVREQVEFGFNVADWAAGAV